MMQTVEAWLKNHDWRQICPLIETAGGYFLSIDEIGDGEEGLAVAYGISGVCERQIWQFLRQSLSEVLDQEVIKVENRPGLRPILFCNRSPRQIVKTLLQAAILTMIFVAGLLVGASL